MTFKNSKNALLEIGLLYRHTIKASCAKVNDFNMIQTQQMPHHATEDTACITDGSSDYLREFIVLSGITKFYNKTIFMKPHSMKKNTLNEFNLAVQKKKDYF